MRSEKLERDKRAANVENKMSESPCSVPSFLF